MPEDFVLSMRGSAGLFGCPNCQEELELDEKEKSEKKFVCPECNMLIDMLQTTDINNNLPEIKQVENLTPEWANHLNSRIAELESRFSEFETMLPESNIINQNFWTRALAVFGHQLAIGLIIYGILFILLLLANQ